ncbi:MAG: hypothetical protein ACJ0A8_03270, partial [Dehalococcoidia bacterium]
FPSLHSMSIVVSVKTTLFALTSLYMTSFIILSINKHITSPFYLAVLGNCDLLSGLKDIVR